MGAETVAETAPTPQQVGTVEPVVRPISRNSRTPESWNSRNPGNPSDLIDRILQRFDPSQEVVEKYLDRITRQAFCMAQLFFDLRVREIAYPLPSVAVHVDHFRQQTSSIELPC